MDLAKAVEWCDQNRAQVAWTDLTGEKEVRIKILGLSPIVGPTLVEAVAEAQKILKGK